MCNALSPEKAVIWSVLHGQASAGVRADDFTHPTYRHWFEASQSLKESDKVVSVREITAFMTARGYEVRDADVRALKRLLRVRPPMRIVGNAQILSQALADRRSGRRVHIERLIN